MKKIAFLSLDISNTFNELLAESVSDTCADYGYRLTILDGGRINSVESWESPKNRIYHWLDQADFDGLIVSSIFSFVSEDEKTAFLKRFDSIPSVLLIDKAGSNPSIAVDNTIGFVEMIKHLITRHSCKNFAAISGPIKHHDTIERYNSLISTLHEYGLNLDQELLFEGTYNYFDGVRGVSHFYDSVKKKFDALICFNDNMALGALQELKRRDVNIPHDLKVTGFDNTRESFYVNPGLTTVSYPMYEMGVKAVELLHSLFDKKSGEANIVLPTFFIPRRSTDEAGDADLQNVNSVNATGEINARLLSDALFDYIKNSSSVIRNISIDKKSYLTEKIIKVCGLILENIRTMKADEIIDIVENEIYGFYKDEWSHEYWPEIFGSLKKVLFKNFPGEIDSLEKTMDNLETKSWLYSSKSLIQRSIYERKSRELLTQLSEDIGTAFDTNKIRIILANYLNLLNVEFCEIVIYDKDDGAFSNLYMRYKNGDLSDSGNFKSIRTSDGIFNNVSGYTSSRIVEPLYVRDEQIGYIILPFYRSFGLVYKSLSKQISTALKGASLMKMINEYSAGLEDMVKERTLELELSNIRLKEEVAKREKIEKILLRQKNYESLGQLAGGIAHDFNNYLTGILGNIALMKTGKLSEIEYERSLNDMESVTKKATGLTQQLLTFSKGGLPIKRTASITPLVEEIARFLLRGSSVDLEFKSSEIKNVDIDENQFSQVLHNIIINAVYAMNGKGRLLIDLHMHQLQNDDAILKKDEYLVIEIRDTGCGMSDDVIDRIFDPFFTTKKDGSGLGLATSLGIIQKHGGDIRVISKPGEGTSFLIYIPAVEKDVEHPDAVKDITGESCYKILLLEDDDLVASMLMKTFSMMGHHVVRTNDGNDTIREHKKSLNENDPFDLIIADLTIAGGLGGRETIAGIRAYDNTVKAIVTSGYSDVPVMSDFIKHGFNGILKKPFTISELRHALDEVMNAV